MGESIQAARRWLYRNGRPHGLARALNRFWAIVHARGILPSHFATLEVRGRRSGRVIAFPVVVADYEGGRFLVSMLGENANWVRNVRAAGGEATLRHGGRERILLVEETDTALRARVLRRYLSRAPGARPHVPVARDAPLEDFEWVAARYPVFRVVPHTQ